MPSTIELSTDDGPLPVYDAEPDGDARGAVVVIQEAFGVNDHIEDVVRRFAAEGFRAVAPHLFHRTGDPSLGYGSFEAVKPHMRGLTSEGLDSDLDATFGYLHEQGIDDTSIAIVGFCVGGTVALIAGVKRPLGAAVSFYGTGITEGRFGGPPLVELAPHLRSPWLGLYGDQDQAVPVEQVTQLEEAAARAAVPTRVIRYPDAGHGFHCDARDAYHEPSAADAWACTLAWLSEHLRA